MNLRISHLEPEKRRVGFTQRWGLDEDATAAAAASDAAPSDAVPADDAPVVTEAKTDVATFGSDGSALVTDRSESAGGNGNGRKTNGNGVHAEHADAADAIESSD